MDEKNFLMYAFAMKDLTVVLLQVRSCAMCTNGGCTVSELCPAVLVGFCVRESLGRFPWLSAGAVLTAHTQALGPLPPLYGLFEFHILAL